VVIFRTLEREIFLASFLSSREIVKLIYIGGWGIRTAERVKANSFMMEYLGVVLGVNSDAAIKNVSGNIIYSSGPTCITIFRSRYTNLI